MYGDWVIKMNHAESAADRRAVVSEMCRMYAIKEQKAYALLKEAGWHSGRKRRKDAGSTGLEQENLTLVASMLQQGIRKNGKKTLSVNLARAILIENGYTIPIKDSRLRSLLRETGMAVADTKTPAPHQRMRSEYPNQIHQTDPSVCLLYFAPGGGQKIVGDDEEYKNKSFLEKKMKCYRYVLTDHYSSSICVRYYAAMGESAANMYDFLLYAWGQKYDPLYAFHGLPETLVWDCGTGNIARAVTNALTALRVQTIPHLPGNPRAKGQVEKANDIVETQFESRLRFEPVMSIEELNNAAERWCAAYNANMIRELDCRLSRNGKKIGARLMLWQKIKLDQLRELPDETVCRQIFTTGIQTRKVGGDLAVSMVHPNVKQSRRYSVAGLPGILVGMDVNVQPVLVDPEPLAKVSYKHDGEIVSYEVKPIAFEEDGFDINAPVFGKEYKRLPETTREKTAKQLAELALAGNGTRVPFGAVTGGEGLKAHSFINAESPFIKQRTGKQITISEPETVEIHDILISHFESLKRVSARLGYVPDGFMDRMKEEHPEGVPASLVDDFAKEYETGGTTVRFTQEG